ncbi:MAG: dependent ligase, partial [Myxococcaceae bacterium]|nr:dependent ligase [Myxococcaceae bacterium]
MLLVHVDAGAILWTAIVGVIAHVKYVNTSSPFATRDCSRDRSGGRFPDLSQVGTIAGGMPKPAPVDEKFPRYRAQLATLVDRPPDDERWLHEIKLDGYRMGCAIEHGVARLESRNGQDWTEAFPEIVAAAAKLPVKTALLDGEVAMLMPDGRTSFQALQNAGGRRARGGKGGLLVYFVFDLLYLDGDPVARRPLLERKAELERLLERAKKPSPLRYSEHFLADGPAVFAQACKLGLEGILSKRRDRPYQPGRGPTWLKSKCLKRQEFVVGGFTEPEGTRQGIGALLVG